MSGGLNMKVFLTHESASKPFVRQLAHDLALAAVDAWVDEAEIGPGESIIKRISQGIHLECDALIAVVSRAALKSAWVQEELDQAKYAEITKPHFQLIVILLDDIDPEDPDLPAYLRGKKHVLWEQERPLNTQSETHPAVARIVAQLYKGGAPILRDEAAQDAAKLLDRVLTYLYAVGSQREVTKLLAGGAPTVAGEVRRDLSHTALPLWSKYSSAPREDLTVIMSNFIASVFHVDMALMDWARGYNDTDFQESVVKDFRSVLARTSAALDLNEMANKITQRLDLQRSPEMAVLYDIAEPAAKSDLFWAADVTGQLWRFGIIDMTDTTANSERARPIVALVSAAPYAAWQVVGWPYPM